MNPTPREVATPADVFASNVHISARSGLSRLMRAVFSFPVFLAFALVVLTALTVEGRFDDPDVWWHLRMGQVVWTTHAVPTTDLFSHTAAGHSWIPHEWLSQVSIYCAYRMGGYQGMMLWLVAMPSLLLVLLYRLSWLYSGHAKIAFLGGLIGWYFGTVGFAIRPLIPGHALLVVELLLLELGRVKNPRWFWGLPPLFALWVNCHGSYSFGLLILAVVAGCSFRDLKIGPIVASAWPARMRKTLIVASLLSGAALFCNPMGWRLLTYPLNVLFLQHTGLAGVDEWLPLPFFSSRSVGLLLIVGGVGWAAAARVVQIRLEELILVGIGAVMAVQHQRMLFLFGVLAAPVVCRLVASHWEAYDGKRDLPIANAVCIAIAVLVVAISLPGEAELTAQVKKVSPVGAVKFIQEAQLTGPMINDYGFGGYLIWALPEHKVFVDGRGDVFDWTGVLEDFRRWALLEEDPQILLNRYHIQFCVLESNAPISHVMPYLPGWSKAYGDARASVFVRKDAAPPQAP